MALNEIQMKQFREGSSGTDGRVDELTLPVDISHPAGSQQAHANAEDLDLEMNLPKENFGADPSVGSSQDDELVHPLSESREEVQLQDDGGRTHQPVGESENTDHIVITVEESDHFCRTCGPDEEITEPDNLLIKLGCNCRGSLSRMHRKCILEWYGPRLCQENNYKCELCNALLHGRIERIVFRALIEGSDILIKAMGLSVSRALPRRPTANVEAPTLQAHGNADPDFQQINIVEIRHPAQRPLHPILQLIRDQQAELGRTYNGSSGGGGAMCVVFVIILVLIGFGLAGIVKK